MDKGAHHSQLEQELISTPVFQPYLRRIIAVFVGLIFFTLALFVLRQELQSYSIKAIIQSMNVLPMTSIIWAVLATILSYCAIMFYDVLAIKFTEKSLPVRKTAFASGCAHAISTTLGVSALTGNAVRYRLYSNWGLSGYDVTVIAFIATTFSLLGAFSLMGGGLLWQSHVFLKVFGLPVWLSNLLGIGILTAVALTITGLLRGPKVRNIRKISIKRPTITLAFAQWFVSVVDWVAAAAVLYFLLPSHADLSLWVFIPIFVGAQYMGTMSGLPGGIGVFEAVFLLLVPTGDVAALAAALIIYRLIYYILPLLAAVFVLAIQQTFKSRSNVVKQTMGAMTSMVAVAPVLYGTLTFILGGVMLMSAATPAFLPRIHYIAKFVPEFIIELSHLVASGVGTLLIIMSLGIFRRLYNAWLFSVLLFFLGAILTYLKGGSIVEIMLLVAFGGCLFFSQSAFFRRGQVTNLPLTTPRFAALIGALSLACWAGFYAHKNQAYSQELWWQFGLQADASRFLRATALVSAIMIVYVVWRLLHPAKACDLPETCPVTLSKVRKIMEESKNTVSETNLALMGDKKFLFSESGQSFIMYGVRGRNWIALGEPIGVESERRELLAKFQDIADSWGACPCFYSVRGRNLNDFKELGMTVQKIGEMALVPIVDYNLAGKSKARFRQARNRAHREGVSFDIIYPEENSLEMDRLEVISKDWLRHHQGREKGFSLGRFDRKVLSTQPIAVARKDGEIIAFSNLWSTFDKTELSLDLMRYMDNCMVGVMDYLFTEVMIWGSEQGYKNFSLGMAPMSGLDQDTHMSLISKLGGVVFKYGGKIYGFQGLRAFKKKFNPNWEAVYIAAPSQVGMPRALSNLALLSAGGLPGLIQKSV